MTHLERVFSVSVPAEAASLGMIRAFFEPLLREVCTDAADSVILALDEACSNVIKHRSAALGEGRIDVRAELEPDRVRLRIGSFCRARDCAAIKPRELQDVRPGGLGTSFIERLMDRVAFEPEPDRPDCVALVLEKLFATGEQADAR